MTLCRVILYGLKPCDISSSTNENISVMPSQRQHSLITTTTTNYNVENKKNPETDYLNLDIKPLITPTNSRSSTSSDTGHEASPMRITIRETPRGRHHICVSQTLLRTHAGDV